ncbi:MAG: right-handed parallel beta-helix repeat-containing protein [Melioribacteraceae bacterium]|nr:right-handed parallel beta-helix repeat-containing protein [Melioribacteraceae bacterium]
MNTYLKLALLLILFLYNKIYTQPSGGPYGPIKMNYEIPKNKNIIYVSTDGNESNSGKELNNPTTIEKAIRIAKSGDYIILRGGVYRTGNLITNQGINIQPYLNEDVTFKGTFLANNWVRISNNIWKTKWNNLFPEKPADWWRREVDGIKTPLHKFNNDMVFVNGEMLQSCGWLGEVNEKTFFIDYENKTVYIGQNPENKIVEITAYNISILRTKKDVNNLKADKKGIKVKGIKFTQYAYRAIEIEGKDPEGISNEKDHGKDVVGSRFENCEFSFCSRVAGYFRGDSLIIKNCKVSDTSTEGIYLLSSSDCLLEKNIFTKNNIENITGYYPAAVKIFNQCYRVTCNDNLVIDLPNSNGIWYDVGNVDCTFTNNWIENVGNNQKEISTENLWPSDNGFFFEISKGVICYGNVFVNCDHGLMILNSSDAIIFNNTFINSIACVGRNERSAEGDHFGWHPSTGPNVDERKNHILLNNIFYNHENFLRPNLFIWQSKKINDLFVNDQIDELNNNLFVSYINELPLIYFSAKGNLVPERLKSIDEFKDRLNKSNNNKFILGKNFFKSYELKNFNLISPVKNDIKKINTIRFGEIKINKQNIGAY